MGARWILGRSGKLANKSNLGIEFTVSIPSGADMAFLRKEQKKKTGKKGYQDVNPARPPADAISRRARVSARSIKGDVRKRRNPDLPSYSSLHTSSNISEHLIHSKLKWSIRHSFNWNILDFLELILQITWLFIECRDK